MEMSIAMWSTSALVRKTMLWMTQWIVKVKVLSRRGWECGTEWNRDYATSKWYAMEADTNVAQCTNGCCVQEYLQYSMTWFVLNAITSFYINFSLIWIEENYRVLCETINKAWEFVCPSPNVTSRRCATHRSKSPTEIATFDWRQYSWLHSYNVTWDFYIVTTSYRMHFLKGENLFISI